MSEFGFQALPTLPTVRFYAPESEWNMTSYVMEHHQRSGTGNGLMLAQMTDNYRTAKDFPSLVYLSNMLQAEGIRYGVEHWRRNMNRVSGTLYWQLNDCWPVASWSSLDSFGRWKALHYATLRFYAPVLLSLHDRGPQIDIHVTSDLQASWAGSVHWSLETLGGDVLLAGEERVGARPLADTHVKALNFSAVTNDDNSRKLVFVAELWAGDTLVATALSTFVPNKHLELAEPHLKTSVRAVNDGVTIDISAASLARHVELSFEGADSPALVFSDNYFDIPAGRTRTVTVPLPEGWSAAQAQQALRVRSLRDSYV
jgi:beta-mannosidase